jgi:16S rRNA (cytidine1402-2'-O)-methyltransferase
MMATSKLGTLYLVPNTLGDDARSAQLPHVMPIETMRCASQLTHWIVEDAKTARALLKSIDTLAPLACPIQEMQMTEWRGAARNAKYGDTIKPEMLLEPLLRGIDIGLMSEAGVPGVADPGAELVLAAHRLGARVKPLIGPSSLLLALMASGLNGQRFAFQGYLPQDGGERTARLKQLESESRKLQQTQFWIETPYRNAAMMASCLQALAPQTHVCLALDLSLPTEEIRSMAIAEWKKVFPSEATCAALQNRPCVFLLLAH